MRKVTFFRSLLLAGVVVGSWASSPLNVSAAVASGLIKGSGPVVFYLASNGRRYAFPNEQTFRTWYRDFASVRVVSEAELAGYPYGGNVTYRPGTRLLKRPGDAKIYTVGRGGVLRWLMTERVVRAWYGQNWVRLVDELPDTRLADYVFGDPISSASGISPSTERNNTPTVEHNRRQPTVARPVIGRTTPPSVSFPGAVTPPPASRLQPPASPPPALINVVAPQSFTVEEADRGVRLQWLDRSNGERGYRVDRRESTGQTFGQVASLAVNTQMYVDRTPRVGVRYVYRVVTLGPGTSTYASEEQVIATRGTLLDRQGSPPSSGSASGSSSAGRTCWPGQLNCGASSSSSGSSANTGSSNMPPASGSTTSAITNNANLSVSTDSQVLSQYPGSLRVINVANETGLRQAWSQVRAGDVIRLIAGTHTLARQLWIDAKGEANHPIYFVAGGGRGSATIRVPSDEGINIGGGARYVVVDGLRVQHTGNNVVHVQDGSHHITLRNLILSDAGEDGDVIKINQAQAITVEGCDLSRPGRRPNTPENAWQELLDVVDSDDVVIRRNWMHDFGNMAGYVKGGSRTVRIEENVISGQRSGEVGEPMWGLGGWTDRELLGSESFEAIGVVFRRNILIGGFMGSLGVYDAQNVTIDGNLFYQANEVLIQMRAGNATTERSENITIQNNHFVDMRGSMPNVCEVESHDLRDARASGNIYWNAQTAIPSESDCGFTPGAETGARREDRAWGDVRVGNYEQAMSLVGRL